MGRARHVTDLDRGGNDRWPLTPPTDISALLLHAGGVKEVLVRLTAAGAPAQLGPVKIQGDVVWRPSPAADALRKRERRAKAGPTHRVYWVAGIPMRRTATPIARRQMSSFSCPSPMAARSRQRSRSRFRVSQPSPVTGAGYDAPCTGLVRVRVPIWLSLS